MKRLFSLNNLVVALCSYLVGIIAVILLQKTEIIPNPLDINYLGVFETYWIFNIDPIGYIVIIMCTILIACILLDSSLRKGILIGRFVGYGLITLAGMISFIFWESQFKIEIPENYFFMKANTFVYATIAEFILFIALYFFVRGARVPKQ